MRFLVTDIEMTTKLADVGDTLFIRRGGREKRRRRRKSAVQKGEKRKKEKKRREKKKKEARITEIWRETDGCIVTNVELGSRR